MKIYALRAPVGTESNTAVATPTAGIKVAAAAAIAAGVYSRGVRSATWNGNGVALLVSLRMPPMLSVSMG